MVYVFLANGFEEVEALAPVDILRRCKLDVKTVGVGGKTVTGSHGVTVTADAAIDDILPSADVDAIILPGGMPGTVNLENSEKVQAFIDYAADNSKLIGAICAAPSILGGKGLLDGKRAVCYPGYEDKLGTAVYTDCAAVEDGNIITSKGAGCAYEFGFKIGARLAGKDIADGVRAAMQCVK